MTMPFYVSPEQVMKDRADYARKGIARGRSVVVIAYDGGILFVAENLSRALHKISRDLRPDRLRRGRQVQRVREPPDGRRPLRRPARLLLRPPGRHRPRAGQRLRPDPRHDLHRESKPYEVEIVIAEVGRRPRTTTRSTGSPTTARWPTSTASSRWAARPSRSASGLRSATATACPWRRRSGSPSSCSAATRSAASSATLTAAQLEVAVLDRARPRRKFRRIYTGTLLGSSPSTEDPTADVPGPRRAARPGEPGPETRPTTDAQARSAATRVS